MFNKKVNPNYYAGLKEEIERLVSDLAAENPGTKEYNDLIEAINKLDSVNHDIVKKTELSKDAVLGAAVSILGILLVINTERVGAITTKAFGMVRKA